MMRLFIGIGIPSALRRRLHLLQGGIPGARWTAEENYHVTLTFIGEADEALAEDIDEALSAVRAEAFDMTLQGTGSFAQGDDPKVLWIGVERSDALFDLKERIDRALDHRGISFEKRKYIPHVTLARFRHPDEEKIVQFMQEHNLFSVPPFPVSEFVLYQSHQTKNGPVYEALKTYPLLEN